MEILIAGGGIGGLTAALCLAKHGHKVRVFEQAPELTDIGAGIQLSPNAMQVYQTLGLAETISANGFLPEAIETRMGRSGRSVFSLPIKDKWDAPYVHIHRAELIKILERQLNLLAPKALKLGQSAMRYEQDKSHIILHFENGKTATGDILIGADGIHSSIREQMLGADSPRFTGNIAWRAVVSKADIKGDLPPPTACAWMGPGRHAVTYHLGDDLINFVGVVESDNWQKESWTESGDHQVLLEDYAGWHPVISNLINAVNPDALYRWALFDRLPFCQWTNGRAALLGDSAHPMLPFLAQGAAMAIEDAYILAQEISGTGVEVPKTLETYQDRRYQRATRVQAASLANMKIFHRRNKFSQLATYGPMWLGGKIAPGLVRARMSWIYDFKV